MKKQTSMKVFKVLRYVLLGGILGYLIAEAVIHGFFDRFSQMPSFHALCPFEAFGSFLNTLTGLEFFSNPFASASVFFLVLILLAILLNRVFCGFLCAFGALQEFIGNLGGKILKKRPVINKKLDRVLRALKYVFLVLSVLLAYFSGVEFFRNLITLSSGSDGFSYIDPWIALKNLLSNNFLVTGYISSLAILVISLVGSFFFQRFYCKYICPLGATFAIFGSLSGLHIHRNVDPAEELCSAEEVCADESLESEGCCDCSSCTFCCGNETYEESVESTDNVEIPEEAIEEEYFEEENDYEFEEEYEEYDDEFSEDTDEGNNYCINCGKCSEVCPMGIDVAGIKGTVDSAECISCQKCVAACPQKGALQTRYFKSKSHPIIILLVTVVLFFGAAFALNFIKIDRGGSAKEPIYDSIRVNPIVTHEFNIDELFEACKEDFATIKTYFTLSEVVENTTLEYCKNASDVYYKEVLDTFSLTEETPLDTSFMEIFNKASIGVTAKYLGFADDKLVKFASYFGAKPEDAFGIISDRFYKISDEYSDYLYNANDQSIGLAQKYQYWHQCAYGPKYNEIKSYYELLTNCEFETKLSGFLAEPVYNVEAMLATEGITLDELKKTYHIADTITLKSTYSEFQDAVMLSYYANYAEENSGAEDVLSKILAIYGISKDDIDLTMTIGELLDSGTIRQAAEFMGCSTEEDFQNFAKEYNVTDMSDPYTKYHKAVNASTDEYYNMLYAYYYSSEY